MAADSKPMLNIAGLLGRYRENEAQCGIWEHLAAKVLGPHTQCANCATPVSMHNRTYHNLLVPSAGGNCSTPDHVCGYGLLVPTKMVLECWPKQIFPATGTAQKAARFGNRQHLCQK
jgi:hypothetical protein